MSNPVGRPRRTEQILRERHVRFLAACKANAYNSGESFRMLKAEFGVDVTLSAVKSHFELLSKFGPGVEEITKESGDLTLEAIKQAILKVKPQTTQLQVALFDEYLRERRKIAEDPSYGIAYADKRRRAQKLSQNVDELDAPKIFARGSYPLSRGSDGSMTFKEFEIGNKEHGEQRKTLQAIGEMMEGQVGGDVIINIHDQPVPEEVKSTAELRGDEKMRALKEKKDANKASTSENREE